MLKPLCKALVAACFLILGTQGDARAALFCAQASGLPPECYYDDAALCRKRAVEISGACMANTAEVLKPIGHDEFCAVYSTRTTECLYHDFSSCDKVAAQGNAACLNNTSRRVPVQTRSGVMESFN